jgi:hypothetical protein
MNRKLVPVLFILLLFGVAEVFAASCPYCGKQYGEPMPGDEARVYELRREHEANCGARSSGEPLSGSEMLQNISTIRTVHNEAARKLTEVNKIASELSGLSRNVFDSLRPRERISIQKALIAATEQYHSASAFHQRLENKVHRMERELTDLQIKAAEEGKRLVDIRQQLDLEQASADSLQQQIKAIEKELTIAYESLSLLKTIAADNAKATQGARREFWDSVGHLFKTKDLGLPRDYLAPIKAGTAVTQRRTRVVKEQATVKIIQPMVTTLPVVSSVTGRFSSPMAALPAPITDLPALGVLKPTGENLKFRINQLIKKTAKYRELSNRTNELLIKSKQAKWQLKASIAAQEHYEKQKTELDKKMDTYKRKLGLCRWELGVRTAKARMYIMDSYNQWKEGQRWEALKKTFELMLRHEKLSSTVQSEIRFAYDLIQGDLTHVPVAVAAADDKGRAKLSAQLQARFDDFVKSTFNIQDDPLTGKMKWIKGLMDTLRGDWQQ